MLTRELSLSQETMLGIREIIMPANDCRMDRASDWEGGWTGKEREGEGVKRRMTVVVKDVEREVGELMVERNSDQARGTDGGRRGRASWWTWCAFGALGGPFGIHIYSPQFTDALARGSEELESQGLFLWACTA